MYEVGERGIVLAEEISAIEDKPSTLNLGKRKYAYRYHLRNQQDPSYCRTYCINT